MHIFLLFSIFLIAVCGIVYELLAGTISSYLVGDSVYQFSLVIGLFMSSMGLGSFLSRYVEKQLEHFFIIVELATGVFGGLSSIVLFMAFAKLDDYTAVLLLICVILGTLIGLELPIILRILKERTTLKILVSNVMTADYIGALFASLLFPIVLVPQLGLIRTGLMFGLMNVIVGGAAIYVFRDKLSQQNKKALISATVTALLLLTICFGYANKISSYTEDVLYKDDIIFSAQTPYQHVVVTRNGPDIRMFINGSIQFSSQDEYRYHEPLIHPAMSAAKTRKNILIIGGGDGLAAREILKYNEVATLTVVDIDPAITNFAKQNSLMRNLNKNSFNNPKTHIINEDAWKFLEKSRQFYDLIFIDLPDPDNLTVSRLYSTTFYKLLVHKLSHSGIIVTQATSPLYSRKAFWCIYNTFKQIDNPYTLNKEKLNVYAYHNYVPSFGEWGFVMASLLKTNVNKIKLHIPLRFLTDNYLKTMFVFPPDMGYEETLPNTIDTHIVKQYYDEGWDSWML